METNFYNQVITKIFIGYPLNAEISLKLHQSKIWQDKNLNPDLVKFQEAQYHGKAYLGLLLDNDSLTIQEMKLIAKGIKDFIALTCQGYEVELDKVCVFSQVLVV